MAPPGSFPRRIRPSRRPPELAVAKEEGLVAAKQVVEAAVAIAGFVGRVPVVEHQLEVADAVVAARAACVARDRDDGRVAGIGTEGVQRVAG